MVMTNELEFESICWFVIMMMMIISHITLMKVELLCLSYKHFMSKHKMSIQLDYHLFKN